MSKTNKSANCVHLLVHIGHTYDVECEVTAAADVAGCVLGATVEQTVVIWSGALDCECSFLVVDLMALLGQFHPVFEPLAGWPERKT